MNPIGIMQGRLSPPPPARLQAFPWRSWAREFEYASGCGFDGDEVNAQARGMAQEPRLAVLQS